MADDRDAVIDAAFRAHAADVYRLALAIVRDPDAAQDVTQESFARAYDRFARFDRARPIGAWLHGIAAHQAVDHLRRARVRRALHLDGPRAIAIGEPAAPGHEARVAERDAVAGLLEELPARSRAMLVLRHAYGYDDRAIAEMLGTSEGNVRTQVSRANARLRELLRAGDEADGWSARAARAAAAGRASDGRS